MMRVSGWVGQEEIGSGGASKRFRAKATPLALVPEGKNWPCRTTFQSVMRGGIGKVSPG